MNTIFKPVKKLLYHAKYSKEVNPFDEFKKLKDATLPPITKGNILVGPIRMSTTAQLFEGVLGHTLRLMGYRVYAVMCGQALSACETKGFDFQSNIKCAICHQEQIEFCKTFDIEPLWIGDYISNEDKSTIEKAVDSTSLDRATIKGIDATDYVFSAVIRYLKASKIKAEHLPLFKKYARSTFTTLLAGIKMFEKHQFEHLVLSHAIYATWGALHLASKQSNVHSVVWGRGYVDNGNILFGNNNSYLKNNIKDLREYFLPELSPAQKEKTIEYFQNKRKPKSGVDFVNYYKEEKPAIDIYKRLELDQNKKLYGLFPNVPWDGQLFGNSKGFPNIGYFVQQAIEWVKEKEDAYLIIRAHPAEMNKTHAGQTETFKDILFELYPTLPKNVLFLPPDHDVSSYQLEPFLEVALLYTGTLGLEFSLNNQPVIQVGNNSNSNQGFLLEPNDAMELHSMLDDIHKNGATVSEDQMNNAINFAYHYIYERHVPETIIGLKKQLKFDRFLIDSTQDLLSNKTLAWIIESIKNKKEFVYRG